MKNELNVLKKARLLKGMKISDIAIRDHNLHNVNERKFNKSSIANIIETDYFKIPTNSLREKDFFSVYNVDIELKVSPLKYVRGKKGNILTTKERNVISMVDYHDIYNNKSWEESKLFNKLNNILFVLYIHDNNISPSNWVIEEVFYWKLDNHYKSLISNDYNIMRENILGGKALREGDHFFLATCPKHGGGYKKNNPMSSKKSSLSKHPIIPYAEKRGFCIKREAFIEMICKETNKKIIYEGRTRGYYKS
tara:strand:- start:1231 stop:1983 length:753 start_codon:yes stop_codon:yes gene_type:complete